MTSRRVAAEAGIKPPLVHYYFRSMDDLFLEVYRRRATAGLERFARAMEVHRSLRTLWRFGTDLGGATLNIEFVALANHRKAIRDEIARYAQRFRDLQLDAIAAILDDHGIPPDVCPPVVVLLAITGVTQVMALETELGVTAGPRGDDRVRRALDRRRRARSHQAPRAPRRSSRSGGIRGRQTRSVTQALDTAQPAARRARSAGLPLGLPSPRSTWSRRLGM